MIANTLLSFTGRMSRPRFNVSIVLLLFSALMLQEVYGFIARIVNYLAQDNILSLQSNFVVMCIPLVFIIPLFIKRFHDCNLSGYWLWSALLNIVPPPVILLTVMSLVPEYAKAWVVGHSLLLLALYIFVVPPIFSGLVWSITRGNFPLNILMFSAPIIGQLWMLFLAVTGKSEDKNNSYGQVDKHPRLNVFYLRFLNIYFSLSGRCTRGELWAFFIIPLLILVIILERSNIMSYMFISDDFVNSRLIIIASFTTIFFWPSICLSIKRLHDVNKSAWWLLLYLIPVVGYIYLTIVMLFMKGKEDDNKYGEVNSKTELQDFGLKLKQWLLQLKDMRLGKQLFIFSISIFSAILIIYLLWEIGFIDNDLINDKPNIFGIVMILFKGLSLFFILAILLYLLSSKYRLLNLVLGFILLSSILFFSSEILLSSGFKRLIYLPVAYREIFVLSFILILSSMTRNYSYINNLGVLAIIWGTLFSIENYNSVLTREIGFPVYIYVAVPLIIVGTFIMVADSKMKLINLVRK